MRVDDSVNTIITISSQWLNDTIPVVTENTISSNSEEMGLEERHNLTFSPLRSEDDGMYNCIAIITPEDGMFVTGSSHNFTTDVTVKGTIFPFKMMLIIPISAELPVPNVTISLNSSTGSGDDSCLNVAFSDPSNTLTCVTGVVSNLLDPPNINITRDGSEVDSKSADKLTYSLGDTDTGVFVCSVCIKIPKANVVNHCSNSSVTISGDGEYVCITY